MAEKIFQNIIFQMKNIVEKTFGILDVYNNIIACSDIGKIGEQLNLPNIEQKDIFLHKNYTLKTITSTEGLLYTVFVEGNDLLSGKYASIIAVAIDNIKNYYDEKYDRNRFVKDIILDNILPGDIYIKARELYFESDVRRAVFIIRTKELYDISVYEALQNIFPEKNKDFIINIGDNEIALVKEVHTDNSRTDIENLAFSISEILAAEFYIQTNIGIGSMVNDIKLLAKSFKEAQLSLEVGKVFESEKSIVSYDNLGIARLIYQLPTTLCESFLDEVFKRGSIEHLDEETLFTIQKFFKNNLNVSEASRQLFIHRNTLLYRLEKVRKITGLDLKIFDHATIFKIALMVNKYLKSKPIKY